MRTYQCARLLSLIIMPDVEKWSGDRAGIKAITGGDAVAIDPKYRDVYTAHIPAEIFAVNNNPMQYSDRSGGILSLQGHPTVPGGSPP